MRRPRNEKTDAPPEPGPNRFLARRLARCESELATAHAALLEMDREIRMLAGGHRAVIQSQSEGELIARICRLGQEEAGYRQVTVTLGENAAPLPARPAYGAESVATLKLCVGERRLGVLNVLTAAESAPAGADLWVLERVAELTAYGLQVLRTRPAVAQPSVRAAPSLL